MLHSDSMALSTEEQHWLPWFGKTGKLAMRWSTRLNRRRYAGLEHAFEGIAQTRVRILTEWANQQWAHLEGFAQSLPERSIPDSNWLKNRQRICRDSSELFLLDPQGRVIASSYPAHTGQSDTLPALSKWPASNDFCTAHIPIHLP